MLDSGSGVEDEYLAESDEEIALEVLAVSIVGPELHREGSPGDPRGLSQVAVAMGEPTVNIECHRASESPESAEIDRHRSLRHGLEETWTQGDC